jgi:hypothetical protein
LLGFVVLGFGWMEMAGIDGLVDEIRPHLYHPVMVVNIVCFNAQPVPRHAAFIRAAEEGSCALPSCYVRLNSAHSSNL